MRRPPRGQRRQTIINNCLAFDNLFGVVSAAARIIAFLCARHNLIEPIDLQMFRARQHCVKGGTFHADPPMDGVSASDIKEKCAVDYGGSGNVRAAG